MDIISEYLRVTLDSHGRPGGGSVPGLNTHTSVNKPQPGARSPTPGPSSPMRMRNSLEGALLLHNTNIPMVDVNNLADDDLLDGTILFCMSIIMKSTLFSFFFPTVYYQ